MLRRELEELEKHIAIAREEGQEEKAREFRRHFEELQGKLKHIEDELNSHQRKDGREEHREDHDNELAKIDEFRRSLRHKLGEIEKQIEVAANEGNEGRVRELKGHYEDCLLYTSDAADE